MKKINGANDVLSDEGKRRRYDLGRNSSASSGSAQHNPDYPFQHTYYGSRTH